MKFMKNLLLLSFIIIFTTSVFAGGSIFGKHRSRTKNPDGIQSIGVHICGTLTCDKVVIRQGSCEGLEHTIMQYGVCLCEEGYHVENDRCVSDNPTGPEKTCPEYAICDEQGNVTGCENGYTLNNGVCEEVVVPVCPEHATACDSEGKATACEDGYYLDNGTCVLAGCTVTASDLNGGCGGDLPYCSAITGGTCTNVETRWCVHGTSGQTQGCGGSVPYCHNPDSEPNGIGSCTATPDDAMCDIEGLSDSVCPTGYECVSNGHGQGVCQAGQRLRHGDETAWGFAG